MGWWSIAGRDDVLVGDEALDDTYHFLESLRRLYDEDHHRLPTVEEVAALLTISLGVHGGPDRLKDMEEREVVDVVIKTKKRPKRPQVRVGDVFAIPLGPKKWGFGRIVNLKPSWNLAEIYAHVGDQPRYSLKVVSAGRLLPPVTISVREAFDKSRWQIIHSDPTFKLPDLESLEYRTEGTKVIHVNSYHSQPAKSNEHVMSLPTYSMRCIEGTEEQIKDALRSRGLLGPKRPVSTKKAGATR